MYPFGHLFLAGLAGVLCFSLNSVFAAEAQAPPATSLSRSTAPQGLGLEIVVGQWNPDNLP
jgi:hypothetical protein